MKIVLTSRSDMDVDEVGFVPWRIAVYVDGGGDAMKNVRMLLESYVKWGSGWSAEEFDAVDAASHKVCCHHHVTQHCWVKSALKCC